MGRIGARSRPAETPCEIAKRPCVVLPSPPVPVPPGARMTAGPEGTDEPRMLVLPVGPMTMLVGLKFGASVGAVAGKLCELMMGASGAGAAEVLLRAGSTWMRGGVGGGV